MPDFAISPQLKYNYNTFYDESVSEWRELGAKDKAENILLLCNQFPHDSILEIGAGEGAVLQRLSDLNFSSNFYALEISQSGFDRIMARKILQLRECKIFDGYKIPYENEKFDLAILSHVIEHVEYPRLLLNEAARIARFVYLEVPLEDTIRLGEDLFLTEPVILIFIPIKQSGGLSNHAIWKCWIRMCLIHRPRF